MRPLMHHLCITTTNTYKIHVRFYYLTRMKNSRKTFTNLRNKENEIFIAKLLFSHLFFFFFSLALTTESGTFYV